MPLFGRPVVHPAHMPPVLDRLAWRAEGRETQRGIVCPHCGEAQRVAARAINTRCTACLRHLLVEDVVVRGDSVRNHIVTCGTILVEPSARFCGTLQGAEVVIAGRVMGTVIGTERVQVTGTGKVAGTIATRVLTAHAQALIDGEVRILETGVGRG
jgi:hypothetical protein